jgi:hypothetical protein
VGVAADLERQRRARVGSVEADPQEGQVERVEHELDLPPDQAGVDLITVAVQRDQGGLGDFPDYDLVRFVGLRLS